MNQWDETKVRQFIYELVCSAEYQMKGTKLGQARKKQVIKNLRAYLPEEAQSIVTEDLLSSMIDSSVELMKQVVKN